MRRFSLATVLVIAVGSALTLSARASTITFETAPTADFTGPVTEDGFTYSSVGGLFVNVGGNPGQYMEGLIFGGTGGVLKIVSAAGLDFQFGALDFAAFDISGEGSQTLEVQGFLDGSLVGTDQFALANTDMTVPNSSPGMYDNWKSFAASASGLEGKTISQLDITLNAGETPTVHTEAIDNVTLTPALTPAPDPSSLQLLSTGLLGLAGFYFRRSRRRAGSRA